MGDKKKDKKLNIADKDAIIAGVYAGTINQHHLPRTLYFGTADKIKKSVYKGFGSPLVNLKIGSPDYKLLKELRTNVYVFSAAKTFQQVDAIARLQETSEALAGTQSFREFKAAAEVIYEEFNENYLRAEYITAQFMARSAEKWDRIERTKDTFPFLRYSAVMDDHTCEICAPMDGVTLPVDDEFWDEFTPPNHFMCKCLVEQLDEDTATDDGISEDTTELEEASRERMGGSFLMNPGKDRVIFKEDGPDKHPYFDVEPKYRKLAENNFNLPIPEED